MAYFQKLFVRQKKWLSAEEFSELVALSQFLPGPGSSQVGFAIGMKRGGIIGGVMAFRAFYY